MSILRCEWGTIIRISLSKLIFSDFLKSTKGVATGVAPIFVNDQGIWFKISNCLHEYDLIWPSSVSIRLSKFVMM